MTETIPTTNNGHESAIARIPPQAFAPAKENILITLLDRGITRADIDGLGDIIVEREAELAQLKRVYAVAAAAVEADPTPAPKVKRKWTRRINVEVVSAPKSTSPTEPANEPPINVGTMVTESSPTRRNKVEDKKRDFRILEKRSRVCLYIEDHGPTSGRNIITLCGVGPTELFEVMSHDWFEKLQTGLYILTARGKGAVAGVRREALG